MTPSKLGCWFLLWLFSSRSVAATVPLTDTLGRISIGRLTEFLQEPAHRLSLAEVRSATYEPKFSSVRQQAPNFGFQSSAFWLRFRVRNDSRDSLRQWVFEEAFRGMSYIDLYTVDASGKVVHQVGGDFIRHGNRQLAGTSYTFLLPVRTGETVTVYVRMLHYGGQAFFPIYVSELLTSQQHDQTSTLLWGIYYGLLLTGFLYHVLLWGFTRMRGYAYLSLYLATYFMFEINRGFSLAEQYIWPENWWLLVNGLTIFFTLSMLTFLNFYTYAFEFRPTAQPARFIIPILVVYIIGLGFLGIFNPTVSKNAIGIWQFLPVAFFLSSIGIINLNKSTRHTQFYFYSLVCFIGGGVLFSLNRAGILPGDEFTAHYTINLGSILEIILMSFGVAFAMRRERQIATQSVERVKTAFVEGRAEEHDLVALMLHHETGNTLLTLLKSVESLWPNQRLTSKDITTLHELALASYVTVREWAFFITPDTLLRQGLGSALQKLVDRVSHTKKVSFLLLISGNDATIPVSIQFELYYVCVELVNNVLKHARATEASLYLVIDENAVTLECRDDGIGYTPTTGSGVGGSGWAMIQRRLLRLHGTHRIQHLPDQGMKVTVWIPWLDQAMLPGK